MKTYSNLDRAQRIKTILSQRRKDIVLVLENIADEKNISMILRTAEAFGLQKIYIIYPAGDKPKISKNISVGASKLLTQYFYTSTTQCFEALKKEKFKLYGTLVDPKAKSIWSLKFNGKIALIMGNESRGLSEEATSMVDKLVYLPMFGLTESLNVAVAAGVFLSEIIRQKTNQR